MCMPLSHITSYADIPYCTSWLTVPIASCSETCIVLPDADFQFPLLLYRTSWCWLPVPITSLPYFLMLTSSSHCFLRRYIILPDADFQFPFTSYTDIPYSSWCWLPVPIFTVLLTSGSHYFLCRYSVCPDADFQFHTLSCRWFGSL